MYIESLKSGVSNFYNKNSKNSIKKDIELNKNNAEPVKNSLSEAIGRSQVVSFKGNYCPIGPLVFEEYKTGLLKKRKKELFEYDKSDGSYVHTVLNSQGVILKRDEYYPNQSKEVHTEYDKRTGNTKTTTLYPDAKYIEETNSDGLQIYTEEDHKNGYSKIVETDYKKQRQITTTIGQGYRNVSVVDMQTGYPVTDGELVLKTSFDANKREYITYNVINGNVYKVRRQKPSGRTEWEAEYYQDTNIVRRYYEYSEKTGGYNETFYNNQGIRTKYISESRNKRVTHEYEFAADGYAVKSHIQREVNKSGQLTFYRIYDPPTDKIIKEFQYGKNSNRCETYYKESPNVPFKTEFYEQDIFKKYVLYHDDGETFKFLSEITDNGDIKNTHYNEKGKKTCSEIWTNNNILKQKIEFDVYSGKPFKVTEYDIFSGNRIEYLFDENHKIYKGNKYDSTGRLTQVCFYTNEVIQEQIDYFADGSKRHTYFDENGKQTEHVDYSADGTKRTSYDDTYQRHRRSDRPHYSTGYTDYSSSSTENTSKPKNKSNSKDPKKEAIQRILSEISARHSDLSSISDSDWNVLMEITEIDDLNDLKNMSSDTFRKIAKKFHPDANIDDKELQEEREPVFIICKALYERTKSGR